ncbi:hypothetical protein Tter_0026 [Thermobaculum terrenum ATCC BAA-798]|uniref:Uncharacterized protein n=1 Tax=Thermobaculum terrenum (strain ATCC BAA-798 / CCMEE 7001 / YNP1) TaxID=525904 RepID=D1CDE3_THET1|nr:hypothetical protein [Thermobaculum terrenum]ACZ40949.1 hypothetical protein Tter_0026 [Thermobaculum terrenum ATCC BAA-798]
MQSNKGNESNLARYAFSSLLVGIFCAILLISGAITNEILVVPKGYGRTFSTFGWIVLIILALSAVTGHVLGLIAFADEKVRSRKVKGVEKAFASIVVGWVLFVAILLLILFVGV